MPTLTVQRGNVVTEQAALAAPDGLMLTVLSASVIQLDWTDHAIVGSIKIESSLNGVDFEEINSVDVGVETFQNGRLAQDTTYYYRIRGFYLPFGYSTYSAIES